MGNRRALFEGEATGRGTKESGSLLNGSWGVCQKDVGDVPSHKPNSDTTTRADGRVSGYYCCARWAGSVVTPRAKYASAPLRSSSCHDYVHTNSRSVCTDLGKKEGGGTGLKATQRLPKHPPALS